MRVRQTTTPKPAKPKLVRPLHAAGPHGYPRTSSTPTLARFCFSAVLSQATGMSTLAYARANCSTPLGVNSQPACVGPFDHLDDVVLVPKAHNVSNEDAAGRSSDHAPVP